MTWEMSEIKPEAIRVREEREQQARLAVKLSLIKNKTRRDWKLMRWCRGQPGAEDPGHTAKQFARRSEEGSDRKAPVLTAKLFTKIKKQRASSVSQLSLLLAPASGNSPPAPPGSELPRSRPKRQAPSEKPRAPSLGAIPKVTTSPQTPRRLRPSHHAAARPRQAEGRTGGRTSPVAARRCSRSRAARAHRPGPSGVRWPCASGICRTAQASVRSKSRGPPPAPAQTKPQLKPQPQGSVPGSGRGTKPPATAKGGGQRPLASRAPRPPPSGTPARRLWGPLPASHAPKAASTGADGLPESCAGFS